VPPAKLTDGSLQFFSGACSMLELAILALPELPVSVPVLPDLPLQLFLESLLCF